MYCISFFFILFCWFMISNVLPPLIYLAAQFQICISIVFSFFSIPVLYFNSCIVLYFHSMIMISNATPLSFIQWLNFEEKQYGICILISIVIPVYFQCMSTGFPLYFHCISLYFQCISNVFPLYFVWSWSRMRHLSHLSGGSISRRNNIGCTSKTFHQTFAFSNPS